MFDIYLNRFLSWTVIIIFVLMSSMAMAIRCEECDNYCTDTCDDGGGYAYGSCMIFCGLICDRS